MAVVGLGVGEAHARAYTELATCRLRAVYDPDPERSRAVVGRLGQGRIAESFESILVDAAIDLVSIASPDDVHAAQLSAALQAGKHVFVEKPLCRSRDELRAIKSTWQQRPGLCLTSNLVLRAAPLYRWLRDAIHSGELGEIYAFDGDYLYGRVDKITDGWRSGVENYSVMQGGGVHLVDLMLWVTGQKPATASAVGNRIATAGTRFRYNDFVAATFKFPSGLVGRVTANFGAVHPHQHVVRVFGSRGTFIFDDAGARLHRGADDSAMTRVDLAPLPASKGELIPSVVETISRADRGHANAQREFDTISVCLAADEALTAPGAVDVEYV